MLVVIAIVATLAAVYFGGRYWLIAANGATSPAQNVSVELQRENFEKNVFGSANRYYASYTFADASGGEHTAHGRIDRDLYDKLAGGEAVPLTVHYSRSWPAVNVLDMAAARAMALLLAGLAALVWGFALWRIVRG